MTVEASEPSERVRERYLQDGGAVFFSPRARAGSGCRVSRVSFSSSPTFEFIFCVYYVLIASRSPIASLAPWQFIKGPFLEPIQ